MGFCKKKQFLKAFTKKYRIVVVVTLGGYNWIFCGKIRSKWIDFILYNYEKEAYKLNQLHGHVRFSGPGGKIQDLYR